MLLRRIAVENVRSFLDRAELILDGPISILIGPNGGGKTNLLDIAVIVLRRYLFASMYPAHSPTPENQERYEFRVNDALNVMTLERHSNGAGKPQLVEVDIEVTEPDCSNMLAMKNEAIELSNRAETKYLNLQLRRAAEWNLEAVSPGVRLTYRWQQNNIQPIGNLAPQFLEYMNNFEVDSLLRAEFELAPMYTDDLPARHAFHQRLPIERRTFRLQRIRAEATD